MAASVPGLKGVGRREWWWLGWGAFRLSVITCFLASDPPGNFYRVTSELKNSKEFHTLPSKWSGFTSESSSSKAFEILDSAGLAMSEKPCKSLCVSQYQMNEAGWGWSSELLGLLACGPRVHHLRGEDLTTQRRTEKNREAYTQSWNGKVTHRHILPATSCPSIQTELLPNSLNYRKMGILFVVISSSS